MQVAPAPNWQPINMLPVLADLLDDQLDGVVEQLELLKEATLRPGSLDSQTILRIIRVHVEQMDTMSMFRQQASRWLTEASTKEQLASTENFCELIAKVDRTLNELVDVARQLKA